MEPHSLRLCLPRELTTASSFRLHGIRSNTTASLELQDTQATGAGNDFGIDTVTFAPVPESPTNVMIVLGIGVSIFLACFRRPSRPGTQVALEH
jgi:hypothetical protein